MKFAISLVCALLLSLTFATVTSAQSSCSMGGTQVQMQLAVPNLTSQNLSVYWKDYQCVEQLVSVVEPNRAFYQTTYDGHEWIFRDPNGQIVEQFVASTSRPLVMIGATVPFNPAPITAACSDPNANVNVDLTTINNTLEPVMLFWINFNCVEELYEFVRGQDQVVIQGAWVGHNWVVRHLDGRVAAQLTLSQTDHTIIINPPVTPGAAPTTAPAVASTTAPAAVPTVAAGQPANNNTTTSSTTAGAFPVTESGCEIAAVTPEMGLDPFYTKYCDFNGILIVGSADASDAAFEQAWLLAANVYHTRPDVVASLAGMGFQISVMSPDQVVTDVPELAYLADDTSTDFNQYRGYDKVLEEPRVVAIGEENLLCLPSDTNFGENIFVNSLGNLTRFALQMDLVPAFGDQVAAARQHAIDNGIWSPSPWNTESNGNYWNYGVQAYFNSVDMIAGPTDSFTNTRAELASYDPQLFALIDSVFNSEEWTPACPPLEVAAAPTVAPVVETNTEVAAGAFPVTESGCEIAAVTPEMGLDPFYTKYCDFNGILIVGSASASDAAFNQAWLLAANVYYTRPDIATSLANTGFQISIMSPTQVVTDVPELAYLADDASTDFNQYRGYDKVLEEPRLVAVAEENLLCLPSDTNLGENIFVNSLGNLARFALQMDLVPTFGDQVAAARQHAIDNGIWSPSPWNTESNGNYWNYGVQAYFNSVDTIAGPTDSFTNTRAELASYDPQLFALIDSVFNSEEWTPACPDLAASF